MKKVVSILALLLAMMMVVGLCACTVEDDASVPASSQQNVANASSTSSEKKLVIGRVIFDMSSPYQMNDARWFETYCHEQGIEPLIMDGKTSAEEMQKCVENMVSKGVDGIVIQPIDAANGDSLVKTAKAAGIPIISFYTMPETESCPYVQLAEHDTSMELGKVAATKWKEWYPDQPIKVGILDFPQSWQAVHLDRAMAFWEGVQSVDSTAELVSELDGGAKRDKAFAAAQDMLQSHPEINMVYGINAETTLGALAAYEESGRGKAVDGIPVTELFVGTGGNEVEAQKVYDPNCSFKITQGMQPKGNAEIILDTIVKTINGEIKMDGGFKTQVLNDVFNYWDTPIDEFEGFLVEQYGAEPGFAKSMEEKISKK